MKICTRRLRKEIMQNNKEWQAAYSVIEQLEQAGFEAVIVGGAVRDALLDRPAHDVDVATNALPEEVKRYFKNCRYWDSAWDGTCYRTRWTCGSDHLSDRWGIYRSSKTTECAFCSITKEDLQRRDFTMNAIAMRRDGSL